jgi:hypothetical protein
MPGKRWLKVPRHGTAVAYIALFVALGGTAYAANTVGSKDIIDNSVQSKDIKDQTVSTKDIVGADISGAVSLSSVTDGRCTQVNLGVSGAKAGEVALVTAQGAMQNGIMFNAHRVVSDGQVTMDVCNLSGTAMTPINDLPIRVITLG